MVSQQTQRFEFFLSLILFPAAQSLKSSRICFAVETLLLGSISLVCFCYFGYIFAASCVTSGPIAFCILIFSTSSLNININALFLIVVSRFFRMWFQIQVSYGVY